VASSARFTGDGAGLAAGCLGSSEFSVLGVALLQRVGVVSNRTLTTTTVAVCSTPRSGQSVTCAVPKSRGVSHPTPARSTPAHRKQRYR
jgi:hypothetical protein